MLARSFVALFAATCACAVTMPTLSSDESTARGLPLNAPKRQSINHAAPASRRLASHEIEVVSAITSPLVGYLHRNHGAGVGVIDDPDYHWAYARLDQDYRSHSLALGPGRGGRRWFDLDGEPYESADTLAENAWLTLAPSVLLVNMENTSDGGNQSDAFDTPAMAERDLWAIGSTGDDIKLVSTNDDMVQTTSILLLFVH